MALIRRDTLQNSVLQITICGDAVASRHELLWARPPSVDAVQRSVESSKSGLARQSATPFGVTHVFWAHISS